VGAVKRAREGAPRDVRRILDGLVGRHGDTVIDAAIFAVDDARADAQFRGQDRRDNERTVKALMGVDEAVTAALSTFLPADIRLLLMNAQAQVRAHARIVAARPRSSRAGAPALGDGGRAALVARFRDLGCPKRDADPLVTYLLHRQ
jgi:hypothetical protein